MCYLVVVTATTTTTHHFFFIFIQDLNFIRRNVSIALIEKEAEVCMMTMTCGEEVESSNNIDRIGVDKEIIRSSS